MSGMTWHVNGQAVDRIKGDMNQAELRYHSWLGNCAGF